MKRITTSILAAAIIGLFTIGACGGDKDKAGGGDKCTKAVDKAMGMAMTMVEAMAKAGGEEGKAMLAKAKEEMKKETPKAVEQCQAALKKDPDKTNKALDCILAAKDMGAMEKCEGAKDLMK